MKKAENDTLDGAGALQVVRGDGPIPTETAMAEPEIDLGSSSFVAEQNLDEIPEPKHKMTWKAFLFFGIPALGLIAIAAVAVAVFLYTDRKPAPASAKMMPGNVQVSAKDGSVSFDNLAAVVPDLSGKQRLVRFGISVMPGKGGGGTKIKGEDREVRIAASRVVSGMPFPELLRDAGRDQVRKKIKTHMEAVYGIGAVDRVWISAWVIL